jgi:hypothetical protein
MSQQDVDRWNRAAHAIMTGAGMEMNTGGDAHLPKHLRTGLDMRAADHEGLVTLLMQKGVFTLDEYQKAIGDSAEREKARYEEHLTKKVGGKTKVVLG